MLQLPSQKTEKKPQTQSKTVALDVGGMKCAGCVKAVERQLEQQPGVISACVNLITEVAVVEYETESIQPEVLAEKLTKTGFPSQLRSADRDKSTDAVKLQEKQKKQQQHQQRQLITATVLLIFSAIGHLDHLGGPEIPFLSNIWFHFGLATLALLLPGRSLLIDGWRGLRHGMPNMNTLVGLGTVSAYLASCIALLFPQLGWECFFDEPVMLLGFILLGRTLEGRARNRASDALAALVSLQPPVARLTAENNSDSSADIEIPVEQVKVGEWLRVLPGETIPVDGEIVRGTTTVDEAMLTGESVPIAKQAGDLVRGGTINLSGAIAFRVTRTGDDTTLAKIINLVESAQTRKAPIQQLADTVAGYFAYGVMTIASLTFLFWYLFGTKIWSSVLMSGMSHTMEHSMSATVTSPLLLSLKLAIAVLAVACPCALGLATPTAILVGTGIGAEKGILIKGGDILEKVCQLDTVVFDKTGTLTCGRPQVSDCLPVEGVLANNLLQLAATAANSSNHPLSTAIVEYAQQQEITLLETASSKTVPGLGVFALIAGQNVWLGNQEWLNLQGITLDKKTIGQVEAFSAGGKTIVYLAKDKEYLGAIALQDQIRPQAVRAIAQLHHLGLETVLLTGDNNIAAQTVADKVGIERVFSEIKPEQKAAIVQSLQQEQKTIAMVGDGINDAPALAQADLGISLQGSTDIAVETADLILMQDKLTDVVEAIALSRATTNKIRQNLFWALAYNLVAIPLAAGVLLPSFNLLLSPAIAAALMASSSLIVVTNSLLLRYRF